MVKTHIQDNDNINSTTAETERQPKLLLQLSHRHKIQKTKVSECLKVQVTYPALRCPPTLSKTKGHLKLFVREVALES